MIFLHPIWLFALGALSIPVAIHLWNTRRGRTLKVGSISLISAASQKRSLNLKVNDLLLLLLRCSLLTLLAFVLTTPFWQKQPGKPQTKGWVLIPKEEVKESYLQFKYRVDSLIKSGFEFHYFNKGFTGADLNKALTDTAKDKGPIASYWSLIQDLDTRLPSSVPVYLFTSNQAAHFRGEKPQIASILRWQTYTPADSVSSWMEKASLTDNNEIRIVAGSSRSSRTSFTNFFLRSGDQQTPFAVRTENGKLSVGLNRSGQRLSVDTSTWHFAIFAEGNSPDAVYVKAALQSIVKFTKHKAVIRQYADAGKITGHQHWVFWLSAKPVLSQLNCDNLFSYQAGKVKNVNSWMEQGVPGQTKIALYKITGKQDQAPVIWRDGFNDPVLSLERQSKISHYRFYTRFDPAWSDLVWSGEFPAMLLKLLAGTCCPADGQYDKRILSDKQIWPVMNSRWRDSAAKMIGRIDLSHYIWLLLALTFFTERWLAHKKYAKKTANA